MNLKSTLLLLAAVIITTTGSGQIASTNPATTATNRFSNWKDQWTNVTVASACPPWGCSVIYERIEIRPPKPLKEREAMQQLAKRMRELKKEEELQKLLQAPALSEAYCVSFSRGTNSNGQNR